MIIFLNNVGSFDANDLSNGTFSNWVNQVYTTYRQTNPCSQQQGQVTQNQITAQIIGSTVQSVVSSILSSSQAQSSSLETGSSGSSDAGGKDNKSSDKKKNNNNQGNGSNSSQSHQTIRVRTTVVQGLQVVLITEMGPHQITGVQMVRAPQAVREQPTEQTQEIMVQEVRELQVITEVPVVLPPQEIAVVRETQIMVEQVHPMGTIIKTTPKNKVKKLVQQHK